MAEIGGDTLQLASALIAALGALNWAAVEFLDEDILVDTLGMTGDPYTAIIAVIGAAGALVAYNVGVVDILGDPLEG